jgi:hypothetical protein
MKPWPDSPRAAALSLALLLSALLSPLGALAQLSDPAEAFERLRDSGVDYEVTGVVCEQVARLELEREYPPPQYRVRTGIVYASPQRVLGELDVVVFRASDRKAVLVAEVKCWTNLKGARRKAVDQRQRFEAAIASGMSLEFYPASQPDVRLRREQFEQVQRMMSISQEGGEAAGFDRSLELTLKELMQVRKRLISCQRAGQCRRPGR